MIIHDEEALERMQARSKAIDDRVALLDIIHEQVIIFERVDTVTASTFLHTDPRSARDRLRMSWYGRVVKVTDVESNDIITEAKKKLIKKDDIISFNPETGYSLNVAGFDEIWIVGTENVLVVDRGFNPMKAKEAAILRAQEDEIKFIQEKEQEIKLKKEILERNGLGQQKIMQGMPTHIRR